MNRLSIEVLRAMAKVLEDEAAQFIPEETPWVFLFDAADALADLVYYLDEERERG